MPLSTAAGCCSTHGLASTALTFSLLFERGFFVDLNAKLGDPLESAPAFIALPQRHNPASMAPRPRQRRRPESEAALFFVPSAMPKRRKHRRNNSLLSPKPFGEKDRIVKDVDEDEG